MRISYLSSYVCSSDLIDANEGPVVNVHHFNSDRASILMYTTQRGIVHTWDLRSSTEPFNFQVSPELGYPTSMTMGHDRNRSEERRAGNECVSPCGDGRSTQH